MDGEWDRLDLVFSYGPAVCFIGKSPLLEYLSGNKKYKEGKKKKKAMTTDTTKKKRKS